MVRFALLAADPGFLLAGGREPQLWECERGDRLGDAGALSA